MVFLRGFYVMEKLNSSQLSKAFQVSKVTIRNWIDKGCPSTKTDKGHEFILSDVIKWHQGRYLKSVQPDEFQKSKATREHFKALITELEYNERNGELVCARNVINANFEKARLIRDQLLNIPSRVSQILAAEKDHKKVNEILTNEIRQCLESLAGGLKLEGKSQCQN